MMTTNTSSSESVSGAPQLIKWMITGWHSSQTISRLVCIRETEMCVWVPERSSFRKTGERKMLKQDIYDTWELAHAALLSRAEFRLESVREELQRAQGVLGNIKGMKKPESAS